MTGIQINLISREKLAAMTPGQRIRFIVDEIKAGKVLVLERGLTAKEELELIRVTMAEIDHKSFIGVETPGFSIDLKRQGLFTRLFGRAPPPRMMVVGPAQLLQTIKKDGEMVQAMIVTKDSMGKMSLESVIDQHKAEEAKKAGLPEEPEDKPLPAPPPDADGMAPPPPAATADNAQTPAPMPPADVAKEAEAGSTEGMKDEPPAHDGAQAKPQEPGAPTAANGEQGRPAAASGQTAKRPNQYQSLSDYPEEPKDPSEGDGPKEGA